MLYTKSSAIPHEILVNEQKNEEVALPMALTYLSKRVRFLDNEISFVKLTRDEESGVRCRAQLTRNLLLTNN